MTNAELAKALEEIERKVCKQAEEIFSSTRLAVRKLASQHGKETVMRELDDFSVLREVVGRFVEDLPNTAKDDDAGIKALARGLMESRH